VAPDAASEKRVSIDASVSIGDASSTTATGVSVGSMGQGGAATVNVNLERLIEEPPQTLREYIKSLWLLTLADQIERRERQAEVDTRQRESETHRRKVVRWLIILTVLSVFYGATTLIWVWQWISRFGWFW
jgi:hypothetical protein